MSDASIPGLTAGQERFVELVSRGTGLTIPVVRAWVLAESGWQKTYDGNPLNIMVPGTQTRREYGSPEAAAQATINLLRTPRYSALLQTAHDPRKNEQAQLSAIIHSSWNPQTQYRLPNGGNSLLNAYAGVKRASAEGASLAGLLPSSPGDALKRIGEASLLPYTGIAGSAALGINGLGGLPVIGGVQNKIQDAAMAPVHEAEKWAEEHVIAPAASAFLYVALSVLSLFLMASGLTRALGAPGPVALATGAVTRGRIPAGDIPF